MTWDNAPDFAQGRLPTQLGGVRVTVNGNPAFVYYISPTQINVLSPLDRTIGPVQIVVTNGGTASAPFTANIRRTLMRLHRWATDGSLRFVELARIELMTLSNTPHCPRRWYGLADRIASMRRRNLTLEIIQTEAVALGSFARERLIHADARRQPTASLYQLRTLHDTPEIAQAEADALAKALDWESDPELRRVLSSRIADLQACLQPLTTLESPACER